MGDIPKSFTVTLGGRTLQFLYEKDKGMGGDIDNYYYADYDKEDISLGFYWTPMLKKRGGSEVQPIFRCQFICTTGNKKTWGNTHFRNLRYDQFYDFPSLASAIVGFKGFLKNNYVGKRVSPKKKASMPFGL